MMVSVIYWYLYCNSCFKVIIQHPQTSYLIYGPLICSLYPNKQISNTTNTHSLELAMKLDNYHDQISTALALFKVAIEIFFIDVVNSDVFH